MSQYHAAPTAPKNILFVCTGNTCRSPMAQALFNAAATDMGVAARAKSAGISAGGSPASPGAIDQMSRLGLDISAHMSKRVDEGDLSWADVVLCMEKNHAYLLARSYPQYAGKVFTLLPYAVGKNADVPDPFGGDAKAYEDCALCLLHATGALISGKR